jgi:hypothetical protein
VRRSQARHTLAAVGIAAVIAALGGAAIHAATSGSSNATGPGMHGPGPNGFGPGGGPDGQDGQHGPTGMGPGAALHGEFVVSDQNGGYTTELVQTGVLTAVSETSITAKSDDGFMRTYTIAPGSRAANAQLAVDDTVTIRATKANGEVTATMVTEGGEEGPGGPPPQPR